LLTRTDNPRRAVSDLYVLRGSVVDRDLQPINASLGMPGQYNRQTLYPDLSNVVGYTSLTYGQSGLEASLDSILRGLEYNPFIQVWWNHLIYGQPPPGLDVRLTIDLDLQRRADALLGDSRGALVLLNAHSGEILAMASHPAFDSNRLDENWSTLINDPASPLLNRATLGRYPVAGLDGLIPDGIAGLGVSPTPSIHLPTGDLPGDPPALDGFSPLQLALASAALTADGVRPAPLLAAAVNLPDSGWTPLPVLSDPQQALSPETVRQFLDAHAVEGQSFWQIVMTVHPGQADPVTWYLGGALPETEGISLALALVLEQDASALAESIGQQLLAP